jgi:Sec-independent protein translocase protein TatA
LLVHSRELAIVLIVILLAAAGSQLPRLVRVLGESPRRARDDDEPASEQTDDEQAGPVP